MDEHENQFKLVLACHRGTLTSRDVDSPHYFNTREEAIEDWQKTRKFYRSIGYMVWFAQLTPPGGVMETLESNPYY
jgi:hypothetical protein